ncbi:MAG: TIGR04190 family B12-binding domain/radical SAM domain protein [Candidatus Thermoplasmatota archaeon]|nr:TIGR04190 family B12-binding domain/radical SAM domain protein [Candidatus Thermoplasmatota archaeon]
MHPPSIYDFRRKDIMPGPISDVVPSTPVFEMYPVGFVSMLSYLVSHGFRARISNIASMMVMSDTFDVAKYLKNIETDVFGIDLHWLPHVHGAFRIARMLKEIYPDIPVLMGGFSASYFSDQIIRGHPEIDFVLKGDFQEEDVAVLLNRLQGSGSLESVPSLVYRSGSRVISNPPSSGNPVENVFLNYKILMRNALKYHDVKGHLPYADWINNPEAVTIIEHGCQFNCNFCGGSNFAYRNRYFRDSPVYRNPKVIAEELELAQEVLGAPVFVAGDINLAGERYYSDLFRETMERGITIPLLTEYFRPPGREYLFFLSKAFPDFSAEISPESSIEKIREFNGRGYSNSALEKSISNAEAAGCKKFDVYFTLGLSGQGERELEADINYAKGLMKNYGSSAMRVYSFISPLTPFIDPGSLIYENPEKYGFHITARNIDDYYNLLENGKRWVDFLNYYTDWMSRDDIERLTYRSEIEMIEGRVEAGLVDRNSATAIISNIKNYIDGKPFQKETNTYSHLSYLNKDIEWSKKHKITARSLLVYWYKNLLKMEKGVKEL